MVRQQFFIREEQEKQLKAIADREGVSFAELVRQGIDLVLARDEAAAAKDDSWKEGFRQARGMWKDRTDLDELYRKARERRRARRLRVTEAAE